MDFKKPFVIMDTEFTSWAGAQQRGWTGAGEYREIVQIGAIKVDPQQNFTETDNLNILVRPVINPQLSDYFTDLTHITQKQVDENGVLFAQALTMFNDFCGALNVWGDVWCYGRDDEVLLENCRLYGLPEPDLGFSDVREVVRHWGINPDAYSSGTVHQAAGVDMTGHVHNALHDCRSILAFLVDKYGA